MTDTFWGFQARVAGWVETCFGARAMLDKRERQHRFLEEALELVQSAGCTAAEAHQLVDYVFSRPEGEPHQEAGGVQVTLAALCTRLGIDMGEAARDELARCWANIERIRAKQAAKPQGSPLPGPAPQPFAPGGPATGGEVFATIGRDGSVGLDDPGA